MLAELIPGTYDYEGVATAEPDRSRLRWFAPNAPLREFLESPLTVQCRSVEDIHAFLATCTYVTDQESHLVADQWLMPAELEQTRRGDCEDLALWAWRQLMAMEREARFVCGRPGQRSGGHAWITFVEEGRKFLLEPVLAPHWKHFPRLATLAYRPVLSVACRGFDCRFFVHAATSRRLPAALVHELAREWVRFRVAGYGSKAVA